MTIVAHDIGPVGGMERVLAELILGLRALGHDVTVIARTSELPAGADVGFHRVRGPGRPFLIAYPWFLLAGSLALHTDVLLWVWLIPLAVGAPLLRLYLVCEHTLCPNSDDGFANTRTTLTNPLLRFIMWNLPYHAEHHLLPNIAFHHLPEAHQYLRPHLKHVATGYIQVNREIVRSFAPS